MKEEIKQLIKDIERKLTIEGKKKVFEDKKELKEPV